MITKKWLQKHKDSQNMAKVKFDVPWDHTSLGQLYASVDKHIEGGKYIHITDSKPVAYDLDKGRVTVELTLCVEDLMEEVAYYELGEE